MNRFNNKTTIVGLITLITGIVLGLGIAVWSTDSSRASSAPTRSRAHSAVTADLPDSTTISQDEWDPFRRLERMQEEIDRAIRHVTEQFQVDGGARAFCRMPATPPHLTCAIEKITSSCAPILPNAQASDVKVRLDDGQTLRVSVSQHKQEVRKDGGSEARVTELGQYEQIVTLPEPVKDSDMKVQRTATK